MDEARAAAALEESEAQDRRPPAYRIIAPARQTVPLVFASPHSGRLYPPELLAASRLSAATLRRSEDAYVDELVSGASQAGAPLLCAEYARAYLDLNREPYELDPAMYHEGLPPHANTRSPRVAAGLGSIPRVIAEGTEIYAGKLPVAEAERRIANLWRPYHAALTRLIDDTAARFGFAVLIDVHSMPSAGAGDPPADFVLGDRFGASCRAEITTAAERTLRSLGYKVARNAPYAGGHVTQTYGRPHRNRHALQIEINRRLYLDEARVERTDGFERLRDDMTRLAHMLAETCARLR